MIYILAFSWVLGILIFVHELGHLIAAKLVGVKVLKFSLGFGPKLIGRKIGETEYMISTIPLGGYVKPLGEEPGGKITKEEQGRAFLNQPVRKRAAIVAAGSLANFVLGIFLFSVVYSVGTREIAPAVGGVVEKSPAQMAGIRPGDMIVRIDDKEIAKWEDIILVVHGSEGRDLQLTLKREEETITLKVTPQAAMIKNIYGEEIKIYQIGIISSDQVILYSEPVYEAVGKSFYRSWSIIRDTVMIIIKIIQQTIPAEQSVGGPYTIGKIAGKVAQVGFIELLRLTAIVSISVGFINLFPIPILDGGSLLVLAVEGIRRRPLNTTQTQLIQYIGILIIMLLIAFILYIDFKREMLPDIMKFLQKIAK